MAFSPDSRTALTGSDDDTARLWFLPRSYARPDRLRLWVEVITGLAMNEWGDTGLLKPDEWNRRREQSRPRAAPWRSGFPESLR